MVHIDCTGWLQLPRALGHAVHGACLPRSTASAPQQEIVDFKKKKKKRKERKKEGRNVEVV